MLPVVRGQVRIPHVKGQCSSNNGLMVKEKVSAIKKHVKCNRYIVHAVKIGLVQYYTGYPSYYEKETVALLLIFTLHWPFSV